MSYLGLLNKHSSVSMRGSALRCRGVVVVWQSLVQKTTVTKNGSEEQQLRLEIFRRRIEMPTVSRYLHGTQEIEMRSRGLSSMSGRAGEEISSRVCELPRV